MFALQALNELTESSFTMPKGSPTLAILGSNFPLLIYDTLTPIALETLSIGNNSNKL